MQNLNLKNLRVKHGYANKIKSRQYVKCAICHSDFKTEIENARVCDRCWSEYETVPESLESKRVIH